MAKRFKYEIPVGVLFLVAIGILIYYTIIMTQDVLKPEDTYKMTVYFPNATGLELNDKVKVNGVDSGEVTDIQLIDNRVWVEMRMIKSNSFTLYENYSIDIKAESIMMGKHISVFPGSVRDERNRTYAVIETRENLLGGYHDVLESFTALINENRENVYLAIRNIKEITEKINRGKGTVAKLINEDKMHAGTDQLIKDVRDAVEDSREQAPITSFLRAALTFF
jgi:phospholipid/cholesterol/gamma-HCH transport system substrate-binding protein